MQLTFRLLSFAVAFLFVLATPHRAAAQSGPQSKPTSQVPAPAATAPPVSTRDGAAPPPPQSAQNSQPPAASAGQAPPATPSTQSGTPPDLEPRGYTYDPDGRRDPFVSLLHRGSDMRNPTPSSRAGGLAGLETSEVTLKGTLATRGAFVGIVLGVDNKTYIVRPGDRLLDGMVRTISQDSMVITQQVTDPLSLEKQREVRKVLRQTEEAK